MTVWRFLCWYWVSSTNNLGTAKKRVREYRNELQSKDVQIFVLKPGQKIEHLVYTNVALNRTFDQIDEGGS